jgi:uncharacterized protein YdeI (YjbR/CyaY-like superfamily)
MTNLPSDIRNALTRIVEAALVFEGPPPFHQREYLRWIEEATKPATREKGIAGMMDRLTAPRGA